MLAVHAQQQSIERWRLKIGGVVQGVGFRPFVYAAAQAFDLKGFVGNESGGVFVEIEGAQSNLAEFLDKLENHAPPLSRVSSVEKHEITPLFETEFRIVESVGIERENTFVSPDSDVCDRCLREMFDKENRRYLYPFINCTDCGVRFTIQKNIPYDRAQTTMSVFEMCESCRAEYENPLDRRFHAQPIGCWNCGCRLSFIREHLSFISEGVDAVIAAQRVLSDGQIAAIKGVGGFHLACDAANNAAVSVLRERKNRVEKPFAVMAKDLATAKRFVEISDAEAELLESRAKPIVLLKKLNTEILSDLIAPGNRNIGVMLPYSPLHYLLFHQLSDIAPPSVLVLTSGNFAGEPIIKDNEVAFEKLSKLADAFLLHDREIFVQCDDSVVRIVDDNELPVRRSRGFAPFPIDLPFRFSKPILAVGGELKNTFALADKDFVVMSPHLGDMENLETLQAFEHCLTQMKRLFRVEPEIVVGDLHPNYLASNWAQKNLSEIAAPNAKFVRVQHHHAHIAAVMAENQILPAEKVIGFAFDGTGYGNDAAIWGGEVLVASYGEFSRRAHLEYVNLTGGDAAIKKPYRVALGYLHHAGIDFDDRLPPVKLCSPHELKILRQTLERGFNSIKTSSIGRLFDAVSSLANVCHTISYEAQAAIEFEAALDDTIEDAYEFELLKGEPQQISFKNLLRQIVQDAREKVAVSIISAKFHNAVADLICRLALDLRSKENINKIALSGGTFQNAALLQKTSKRLRGNDFEVLTHSKVPPNDGGLALGQAVIANFLEGN